MQVLYGLGARKLAIFGLGMIGCAPFEISLYGTNGSRSGCVDDINNAVQLFNTRVTSLVAELNIKLPGSNLTYINNFEIQLSTRAASEQGLTTINFEIMRWNLHIKVRKK